MTEAILGVAVTVLAIFSVALAVWGASKTDEIASAKASVAQLIKARDFDKQYNDDRVARLQTVITNLQTTIAAEADEIAKLEDPDERAQRLKQLGSVVSLVPKQKGS